MFLIGSVVRVNARRLRTVRSDKKRDHEASVGASKRNHCSTVVRCVLNSLDGVDT